MNPDTSPPWPYGHVTDIAEAQAESVMCGIAVLQFHFARELFVRPRGKDLVLEECDIPLSQVGRRHGQFPGREIPSSGLTFRRTRRTEGITGIGRGVFWLSGRPIGGSLHAERLKDLLSEKLYERLDQHLLEDRSRE